MLYVYADKIEILDDLEYNIFYDRLVDYAFFIGSFALGKLAMENNK